MKRANLLIVVVVSLLAALLFLPGVSHAIAKKGETAPLFSVTTITGQKVTMANYRGSVLVIEFFATWCGGCKDSIPHLHGLLKQFGKQGLHVLGLDIGQGDSADDLKEFAAKWRLGYPVAMADEDLVYDGYGIRMIPTIFIINRKGVVVERLSGFTDETRKVLDGTIKRLVAE